MGHEKVQQPQLGGPEVDRLVARAHDVRRRVDAQAGDFHHVVGELRRAAAHHGLDPCEQLPGGERLGHVVVGAGLERGHLVLLLDPGRQQHDRDVLGALVRAQRSEEHTSELQSPCNLVCRLLLEKKKKKKNIKINKKKKKNKQKQKKTKN